AALACRRAVAANAEGGDIVVERDVEPVLRRAAPRFAEPVDQLVAHEPPRLPGDRRHLDGAKGRRDRARRSSAVERMKAASRQSQASQKESSAPHHATIFTSRSRTTITLHVLAPASCRCTLSDARTNASASSIG